MLIFLILHFIMLLMTLHDLSIHLFSAYLSPPPPPHLFIYLSRSLVHTWLSTSHLNVPRKEIIFSVTHPAVYCYAIWCKQMLNTGDDIAYDLNDARRRTDRGRKPGVNNQIECLSQLLTCCVQKRLSDMLEC